MENIKQENTQKGQQENLIEGEVIAGQAQTIQLVLPKEAQDEIAKLEKQYRKEVEQENK